MENPFFVACIGETLIFLWPWQFRTRQSWKVSQNLKDWSQSQWFWRKNKRAESWSYIIPNSAVNVIRWNFELNVSGPNSSIGWKYDVQPREKVEGKNWIITVLLQDVINITAERTSGKKKVIVGRRDEGKKLFKKDNRETARREDEEKAAMKWRVKKTKRRVTNDRIFTDFPGDVISECSALFAASWDNHLEKGTCGARGRCTGWESARQRWEEKMSATEYERLWQRERGCSVLFVPVVHLASYLYGVVLNVDL